MRPLRLKLKGFTAFREECTLDLEGFDLFAITGPTGSGKSSLLDAMTYALYGKVDRVGKEVRELIAQGQPRMSVTLEFAVGEERYRVARSTPVRGASKAVLERWVDGGWRPEPAEGVRGVDAAVERIVGLDYEAFTRSVLLPQNRFAEFLVGDAAERRRILTELLGLELFERLARRAGELRREAESEGRAKRDLLAREYADASEEAVARAERARQEAEAREETLTRAEREVDQLLARWREAEREAEALVALAGDARGAAGRAEALAEDLGRLAEALARAGEEREALAERARALAAQAAAAEAELAEAEGAWGKAPEVAALLGTAQVLERARAELDRVEAALETARSRRLDLEAEVARAAGEVEVRAGELQAAQAALARADEEYRSAQHRHLAAAVRAGVRVGEPCPVCGAVVERLPPPAQDERGLTRAERATERAHQALERARRALQQAEGARDRAALGLEAFDRDLDRLGAEAERCRREVAEAEAALAPAFGDERPPPDAAAELGRRAARLDELSRVAREARDAAAA
ncbi:MAG TPA: AAA family ATPase, partial [Actinomycetota bacterium]|nr:AAA family ATPase [Actinomycetota bacterium]